jgi:hypothetical protein
MPTVLDAAWEHLLPAFGSTTASDEAADADLRRRLASLELPPARGDGRPKAGLAAELTPQGGRCTDQPSLIGVTVTEADESYLIKLAEADWSLDLRCVPGSWTVSDPGAPVPTAVSGGWTDPDTLTFDVAFLETPHHFIVTCSLPDTRFQARWRTVPLHGGTLRSFQADQSIRPDSASGRLGV